MRAIGELLSTFIHTIVVIKQITLTMDNSNFIQTSTPSVALINLSNILIKV